MAERAEMPSEKRENDWADTQAMNLLDDWHDPNHPDYRRPGLTLQGRIAAAIRARGENQEGDER